MVTWGMRDEEVDLSLLYDLLRQQFRHPDDPWVKETLEWWDRCVVFRLPASHPLTVYLPVKFFRSSPTETTTPVILGTQRVHR